MVLPTKTFLFSVLILSACSVWAVASFLSPKVAPALHSAVFLPKPVELAEFQLLDHRGQLFTKKELIGKWSIVAYGYTYCPDICPTTLSTLVKINNRLKKENDYSAVNWLFYSVDHQRDTAEQLQGYLSYFPIPVLGLTKQDDGGVRSFEKSLGILSQITPVGDEAYEVAHGVYIYLINPKGELQTVFKPQTSKAGVQVFSEQMLLEDYLKVRAFL